MRPAQRHYLIQALRRKDTAKLPSPLQQVRRGRHDVRQRHAQFLASQPARIIWRRASRPASEKRRIAHNEVKRKAPQILGRFMDGKFFKTHGSTLAEPLLRNPASRGINHISRHVHSPNCHRHPSRQP